MCSVGRQTLLNFDFMTIPASHNLYFKRLALIMYTVCTLQLITLETQYADIHQTFYYSVLTSAGIDSRMLSRDLRSFKIRFDFESNFRFGIRFVMMIRFEIFESSAPSIVLCKETIGGG